MTRLKLAVLISGRGSNLRALAQACADPGFPAEIVLVLSSRPDAPGLQLGIEANVASIGLDHKVYDSREAFDAEVEKYILESGADLVCLAGFMRIFSVGFSERWEGKVINIHPSLLPLFPGLKPHRQALEAGVRLSGATVHYTTPDVDAGPIIGQAAVPVEPEDTEESLSARILEAEHKLYPLCVRLIAEGRVVYENKKVRFRDIETGPQQIFSPAL